MSEREKLLNRVRMYDFCLYDTVLYLDGHPKNSAALAYYDKMKKAYEQAVADYERVFGPLTKERGDVSNGTWTWVNDPWPWEGADN